MAGAPSLSELLVRWQELRARGQDVSAEELCAGCPELLEEVRNQQRALASMEDFLGSAADGEPNLPSTGAEATDASSEASPVGGEWELDGRSYVLHERVGRGGMGEVFRARDPALARSLAIKVLRPELGGHAEAERRFEQEARINGLLQHPSIVPVHNLGRLPDGRLYFTMKLVRGRTLADLLEDSEPAGAGRLPQLLGIFEKVCQALAYAHSLRVIHRDLKPLNVMVGAFGEVQVMDWGLAKVLERPAPAGDSLLGSLRGAVRPDSTVEDQPTGVVGTPAYMAPEQARGVSEAIDERTDVFGLGAILCELLTGEPPYAGDRALRKASDGDLSGALAQLDRCGADGELVALCGDCLAVSQEQRPQDAGAVAARVAAYQATVQERLRKAELERTAAEAREQEAQATAAAERKARRRMRAIAGMVLLLVVGGGGGAWWLQQQRQRAEDAAAPLMEEARRLLEDGRKATSLEDLAKFDQARAAARTAEELARNASAATREQAAALAQLAKEEAEAAERDQRLTAALLEVWGPREGPQVRTDNRGMTVLAEPSAEEQFQAAFREWDATFDVDAVGIADLATRLKRRPPAVVVQVVAALDEWTLERQRSKPAADWRRVAGLVAALEEPDANFRELRVLMTEGALSREKALGMLAVALRPVPLPFDVGLTGERARLRRIAGEMDVKIAPVLRVLTVARALNEAGERRLAVDLLREALRARPKELVFHLTLGRLLAAQERWPEAIECFAVARSLLPQLGEELAYALVRNNRFSEGLALYQRLLIEQDKNLWLRLRYGIALYGQGRPKEAEEECRAATRIKPGSPEAHTILGYVLNGQGRPKEAEEEYRAALRLKPDDLPAHLNLGAVLNGQGRPKEAEEECRAAIRLKPDSPEAHGNLGNALYAQGRPKEAEEECRTALRLKPGSPEAHSNLGSILTDQGRPKEGEEEFRAALRLKPDSPIAHYNLGNALTDQGRPKEAEEEYRTAIRLKPDYSEAHDGLGIALYGQGRLKEAEEECRTALRLKPGSPEAHSNLGSILTDQGRPKEAEEECRAAIRLKPDHPEAHNNLGNVLDLQGRPREAEEEFRAALRLKPDFPQAHYNLGNVLYRKGRHKEAEEEYRAALRLKPDDPKTHGNLGIALQAQGRFAEALKSLRRCDELGRRVPGWRHPSIDRVRKCERLIELDQKLPGILRGETQPSGPAESLQLAELCQIPAKRLYTTASRLYADAFAANPKLADDVNQPFRYNAACSACLAASGKGEDARLLPDKVVVMLRRQALGWLRADLALYAKLAEQDAAKQAVQQRLEHWQRDPDLASIRDLEGLATLPDAERPEWQRLWEDVAAVLRKAEKK
jgi:serine/threonine-protein kinase